jgi:hypothetical protein
MRDRLKYNLISTYYASGRTRAWKMRSSCWAGHEIIPTTEDVLEEVKNGVYTVFAAVISCIGNKVKKREGGVGWTRG